MNKQVLNYRIIIDKEGNKKKPVFVSQVPTLGISDYGSSVEEVLKRTEKLIKFHIESLIAENKPIPEPDNTQDVILTNQEVEISSKRKLSFA